MPEETKFEAIEKYESMDKKTLNKLVLAIGPLAAMVAGLGRVDVEKGAGVIDDRTKCIWTTEGNRVTFSLIEGGGYTAAVSKAVDPLHDPAARPGGGEGDVSETGQPG
jgi:hypothetical protein